MTFSAAWPEALSAALPRFVAPSKKVTLAVGVPAAGATAVTVAVSVMFWPDTEGLAEEAKEIVVEPALTVRSVLPEIVPLLAAMLVLPVFFAVVKPLPLMIAAAAFDELQITDAVMSCVVLSV